MVLVSELLVCCLKFIEFCPDFSHSFCICSFSKVASKVTVNISLLSSLVHFLGCGVWCECSICSSFVYLKEELFVYQEKEQAAFARCYRVLQVGYQGSTSRSWHPNLSSVPHLDSGSDLSFSTGRIVWLYKTQVLFIISELCRDVIEKSYDDCSWTAGLIKNKTNNFFF